MTMTPISMNKDHYCADDPNPFPYIIERLMAGAYLRREVFFLKKTNGRCFFNIPADFDKNDFYIDELNAFVTGGGNLPDFAGLQRDWSDIPALANRLQFEEMGDEAQPAPLLVVQGDADRQIPVAGTTAFVDRHMQLDFDVIVVNEVDYCRAARRPLEVQSIVIAFFAPLNHHDEFRLLPRKRRLRAHGANGQSRQISVGMQRGHNKQGGKQKGQCITEVILKVDRRYQHHQQATAKKKSGTAGKYKDAALVQRHFACRWIAPIDPATKASAHPPLNTVIALINAVLRTIHRGSLSAL